MPNRSSKRKLPRDVNQRAKSVVDQVTKREPAPRRQHRDRRSVRYPDPGRAALLPPSTENIASFCCVRGDDREAQAAITGLNGKEAGARALRVRACELAVAARKHRRGIVLAGEASGRRRFIPAVVAAGLSRATWRIKRLDACSIDYFDLKNVGRRIEDTRRLGNRNSRVCLSLKNVCLL
jgi:hypothetical protein